MKVYIISKNLIRALVLVLTLLGAGLYTLGVKSWSSRLAANQSLQSQVVRKVNISEKLVALTFDDGPGITFTPKILDLLKWYHASSTFFIVGEQAEKNQDILIRELREGHEIGIHMYLHRNVCDLPEQELRDDLTLLHQTISQIAQSETGLYRPTNGYYDETIIKVAHSLNYTIVLWNIDSRDWTGLNGCLIAQKIIKKIKPGSIILFHDFGGNRSNTIAALKILLPQLTQRGYTFVTVSTLLEKASK